MQTDASKLMNIGTASEYLGVSIDTLRRWEKRGKLEVYRSPGGHRYFHKDDLDKLFGKKYERAEETKPRKRKIAEVETIKVEPERREPKGEEKAAEEFKEQVKETILDRPTREVKIPQVTLIRVKQDFQPPSQMIHNDIQSNSVLTPVVTPAEAPAPPPPVPQTAEPKKETAKEKVDSKTIALILGGIGLIIILVALFIWWQSSQRILSPVP